MDTKRSNVNEGSVYDVVADMDARETLTVAKRNSWSERVNQRHNAYLELYFAGAFRFSNSKRTLELSYPAKKLVVAMQSNRNGRLELGSNQFTILNNLVTIYLNEGINPPIDRLVELPKDVDSLRRLAARVWLVSLIPILTGQASIKGGLSQANSSIE